MDFEQYVSQVGWMLKYPTYFEEALGDLDKYMDLTMINYMNDNLNDPARRSGFLKAMKRFADLAASEKDPVKSLYYEYRMYLPSTQAMILAREFYQKELRSGTYQDVSLDDENGESTSLIDSLEYGNPWADKGMFASLTKNSRTPARSYELDDFLTKLFKSPKMDRLDRIVLILHLFLGTGPSLRARGSGSSSGLDLETVMNNPPAELQEIKDMIKKLLEFGINPKDLNRDTILAGAKKGDAPDAPQIVGFMSNTRKDKAIKNIQAAIRDLTGLNDMDELRKLLLAESLAGFDIRNGKPINEASKNDVVNNILKYLKGERLKQSELISVIVNAVDLNIKARTELSKSREFSGSIKDIARRYLNMAKAGGQKNIYAVQDMLMAPVFKSVS